MTDTCGKKFLFGEQRCARHIGPAGHLGLHRDHNNPRRATINWGDNETENQK